MHQGCYKFAKPLQYQIMEPSDQYNSNEDTGNSSDQGKFMPKHEAVVAGTACSRDSGLT